MKYKNEVYAGKTLHFFRKGKLGRDFVVVRIKGFYEPIGMGKTKEEAFERAKSYLDRTKKRNYDTRDCPRCGKQDVEVEYEDCIGLTTDRENPDRCAVCRNCGYVFEDEEPDYFDEDSYMDRMRGI